MARDYHDTSEEQIYEKSKINPAAIINITLENLWKEAYYHQARNRLWDWNRRLDSIWLILGGDEPEEQKDPNRKDWVKAFNELDLKLNNTGSLIHKEYGFNQMKESEVKTIAMQYQLLKEKSLFLRRLQNKQGKGTAYDTGEEDYMDK